MTFAIEIPYLLDKVWLFPAIMAGSFLIILFFGKRFSERVTSSIGILAVTICFVMSLVVAGQWIARVNHPPEGAELAKQELACGATPHEADAEDHASEDESHATGEPAGEHGEEPAADTDTGTEEHSQPVAGVGPGESASAPPTETAAPATEEPSAEGGEAAGHESVPPVCATFTWFQSGEREFGGGTLLDGLSAMMLFTVTLISMLVHWYSKEYLHEDRRFTHYYAFLSLFTSAMLFYVLGTNTLQMLVGWELVGVCSFALIGHWWEERNNTDAALKAFMTNRVGDVGLLLGVIITFFAAGARSFDIAWINEYALSPGASTGLLVVGALCLFAGVTSKSGQFPLHTWLPDAMAGPTPVSALIHAATMVVAGVYLIARLYPVFYSGLEIGDRGIHYVALIGGITTIVGASLAFVQTDLKKVLAYSTISQLGYMVMALGVGAWTAGVFHLFTHAMFKACLFLCAGSVSHACHHTFDMREMGGLKDKMKITHWCFILSGLALCGIFPFAGFFSKDEILVGAFNGQQNPYLFMFVMGLITAFMTACYMGRAYWLTFQGSYRGHAHPHESPKLITVPLMILAALSLLVGFLNFPIGPSAIAHRFEHYVQPTFLFPPIEVAKFNPGIALLSMLLAIGGLVVGIGYFAKDRPLAGLTERVAPLRWGYQFLVNKLYLDFLYDNLGLWIRGQLAAAMYWVNMKIIDKVVVGAGVTAKVVGGVVYRFVDQGVVDTIVNGSGAASESSGQFLRRSQTGKVQQYASLLFGGVVAFVVILLITVQLSSNV
jgi:NADH-quinone oxidoreductase subunit L